jgi:hypothetical protein
MNRNQEATVIIVGCLLLTVFAVGQETRQEWQMRESGRADKVHFSFDRYKGRNHSSWGTDVSRDRFRGLPATILDRGGAATFEYVTDAGSLVCKGSFSWGRGSGTFTFKPDPKFTAELKKLGYDEPTTEQQLRMTFSDVSLEFAREIKTPGFSTSTQQLINLTDHGVTLEYVRKARHAGFRDLSADDFMRLRDHGVDIAFIQDVAALGYDMTAGDMVRLRDHGVNAEFLAQLKDAGYELPAARIAELRDHGVDSNFFRDLKGRGLQPAAGDLIRLRDNGVTPGFLKELDEAGYNNLSAEDIVQLRNHGVSGEFVRDAKALGFQFTPRELRDLHDRGVNGDYLRRIRESGFKTLSAADIAKLRDHGVD